MSAGALLLACLLVALATWALIGPVLRGLVRRGLYDQPNPRSSHSTPTPRGGGLALVPVVLLAWLAAGGWMAWMPPGFASALAGAALLAALGWLDDLRDLSAGTKLLVQIGAVALGVLGMGEAGPVFQGLLPPLLDRLAAAVLWLGFVNVFNFMDGIDGIAGVETTAVGAGLVLVAAIAGWPPAALALPALLAAATLGFLAWNWAPAKIFLGDVGSLPIGYLLAWLLLLAAAQGQWAAALILPLYYLADGAITLAKRVVRGERFWRAHRAHFYQRAVQGGLSHAAVAARVLACDAALVAAAALAAAGWTRAGLGAAAAAVAMLLAALERRAARGK